MDGFKFFLRDFCSKYHNHDFPVKLIITWWTWYMNIYRVMACVTKKQAGKFLVILQDRSCCCAVIPVVCSVTWAIIVANLINGVKNGWLKVGLNVNWSLCQDGKKLCHLLIWSASKYPLPIYKYAFPVYKYPLHLYWFKLQIYCNPRK